MKFPAGQKTYESILLGAPPLVQKVGKEKAVEVQALVTVKSDRDEMVIRLTVGTSVLVVGAANAAGLAKALLEHVEFLGSKAEYLMTNDHVEETKN